MFVLHSHYQPTTLFQYTDYTRLVETRRIIWQIRRATSTFNSLVETRRIIWQIRRATSTLNSLSHKLSALLLLSIDASSAAALIIYIGTPSSVDYDCATQTNTFEIRNMQFTILMSQIEQKFGRLSISLHNKVSKNRFFNINIVRYRNIIFNFITIVLLAALKTRRTFVRCMIIPGTVRGRCRHWTFQKKCLSNKCSTKA